MVKRFLVLLIIIGHTISATAQDGEIYGIITEKSTGEPLTGANIVIETLVKGTVAGIDGDYTLKVPAGTHRVKISFVSFAGIEQDIAVEEGKRTEFSAALEEAATGLNEVVVSAVRKTDTEMSMLTAMRTSSVVMSGVSSQQIGRAQDRNAAEVIRRIPGISVVDDKFIVARGLSQRYNSVWVNNSAVPGSEADSRSFSFDMIPGQQIDNIMIVKSPTPELPADFTGGFVKVTTKNMPSENAFYINYGMEINTQTHFRNFKYNKGSATDFIGFDNGMRGMHSIAPRLDNSNASQVTEATRSGFNGNWSVGTRKPLPGQRLSLVFNRTASMRSGARWGMIAALNYSHSNRTYHDMKNARFGVYNSVADTQEYLYDYTDSQYTADTRTGGLFNIAFAPGDNHRIEFRNMINQTGRNRYTERSGYQYGSRMYGEEKQEYLYTSRLTYASQLAGNHVLTERDRLDWTLGYAYANKNQPDRRIINLAENGFVDDEHYGQMQLDQNEISRDFVKLHENIYSAAVNYSREFGQGNVKPSLKTGAYGEFRNRDYRNRAFYYRWKSTAFSGEFPYRDVLSEILIPGNYGADRLYIYEDTDNRNSYSGNNRLAAAYAAVSIPLNRLNIHTGVRFEDNLMKVDSYTSIYENMTREDTYRQTRFFPSLNADYRFNDKHLVRAGYGSSVNRQEFREVSASVYYDFDLFSDIKGNPGLKPAYIQNFDLRYEFYPDPGEVVSLALFYKHFKNPIEWTYLDGGGSYTYTFENAQHAVNYGLEVDIKKNLDFIGAPFLSLTFNGALINSRVTFGEESLEHERPMQGQSPCVVNAGLFYRNGDESTMFGLLYNIIGRRIVGIGKVDVSHGGTINNDIPDMYEMPRHVVDFTFRRKIGKHVELNAAVKDILAQPLVFKQFPKFYDTEGNLREREQTTKKFKPGQNMSVALKVSF